MHELIETDGAQAVILPGRRAAVIGDVIPHENHEVLIFALVEEQQVAGSGLIEVLGDEAAVVLDQSDGAHERGRPAAETLPAVSQRRLLRREVQFRRQIPVGEAVGVQPFPVMPAERLVHGEPNEARAVLVNPAGRGPLAKLFADDAHEPGAKAGRLPLVQLRIGGSRAPARPQQGDQGAASGCHASLSHPAAALGVARP